MREAEIAEDLKRLEEEKRRMFDGNDVDKAKKLQWLRENEQQIQFREFMKDKEREK